MSTLTIKLLNFEGAFNLPLWVAGELGYFRQHGLVVECDYTRGSVDMVNRLQSGDAQIALTSIDNVIAYASGHGEAGDLKTLDLVAFMGGDRGMLSLTARDGIAAVPELRGTTLAVDAMTTGFAFALRKTLERHGVPEDEIEFVAAGGTGNRYRQLMAGTFDATLVRTPFEVLAQARGFTALAAISDVFPAYLGTVGASRRDWLDANRDVAVSFMLAYRRALKWIFDESNRPDACAMLARYFTELSAQECEAVLAALLDPKKGLILDMSIPDEGVEQVKSIRESITGLNSAAALTYVSRELLDQARENVVW
ncbi:transport protein [Caballeronia peredens]|nr:transport protein [Caballeronia peredens]